MAYLDAVPSRTRPGPVAAVIAIHAGIGYLLVTGLAAEIANEIDMHLPVIEFPVDPPPPPDPVPQPPTNDLVKPQAPKPPLDLTGSTKVDVDTLVLPPIDELVVDPTPKFPQRGKFEPSLRFDPVAPMPRTNPANWVTTDDYPSAPLRHGEEGTARFRLEIAANGKIEACTITRSSGFEQLDRATCRNIMRRAKFDAARDATDKPVRGTYESSVRWQIPD